MKLYTGRGDDGDTDLWSGGRTSKSSPRIEAYGTLDELNAHVGEALSAEKENVDESETKPGTDVGESLEVIQDLIFKAQAELANADETADHPRIGETEVEWIENRCDEIDEGLEPLESFVHPGGGNTGSKLHLARTVCRRAERRIVTLDESEEGDLRSELTVFVNRLSDLLFALARYANQVDGVEETTPDYDRI
ncbi:MAG: cob(I)yrinic acid a,c-diamide adenosyltransferase [Halobacteria archaeon]